MVLTFVARACQRGSLLYPVVFFPCLALTCALMKRAHEKGAFGVSAVPLGYRVVLLALLFMWILVEKRG